VLRVGGKEGVMCVRVVYGSTVQKQQVWEIDKPGADFCRIGCLPQWLYQR
jgi:hypothetical protein